MRPRKKRASQQAVVPITQPIFSSSNNRRGNGTAQQRLFAAHFQATDAIKVVIDPTPHLDQSLGRIEPVPTCLDENGVYGPVDHVNDPETTHFHEKSSIQIEPGPTSLDDNEVHDPVEQVYDPETDDEYNPDSDDEDYDDDDKDPPRFCPELERALAVLLNMRENKLKIHARMRKSHWLHSPSIVPASWDNGKLKLRVRCCAPHLQYPDDKLKYTCVGCHGQDCILKGWASEPRSMSGVLPLIFPHHHR
jgi:hypothetical protein